MQGITTHEALQSAATEVVPLTSDNVRYVRLIKYGYSPERVVALAKAYYRAMKGSRALVWSRNLRALLGIAPEEDDQTIAAQEFADPKCHVLTVWDWSRCLSRREHLAVGLLDVCDKYHGDPSVCLRWCRSNALHTKPPHLRRRNVGGGDYYI